MKLLALDLGTTTGWCMSTLNQWNERSQASGSQSFKPRSNEGPGMRYLKFTMWLDEVGKDGIDWLCFEEVKQKPISVAAGHVYGGFLATLTAWCEAHHVNYEPIPAGTIKKHWTGKGNAGKPEMLQSAKDKGFKPVDDNEADAIAIHSLMLHRMHYHATTSNAVQRPAPDKQPKRRVPVAVAQRPRQRVRVRAG